MELDVASKSDTMLEIYYGPYFWRASNLVGFPMHYDSCLLHLVPPKERTCVYQGRAFENPGWDKAHGAKRMVQRSFSFEKRSRNAPAIAVCTESAGSPHRQIANNGLHGR